MDATASASAEDVREHFKRELERNRMLKAALVQLEHLDQLELGDEQPKDVLPLPKPGDRKYSQEVYVSQHGRDNLYSGLSKRTPTGGFFSS